MLVHLFIYFLLPQEHEDKPEDCIPEGPGNEDARNFLANAPTRGLWMPLGKEVKVMQCEYCTALHCTVFKSFRLSVKHSYGHISPPKKSLTFLPAALL